MKLKKKIDTKNNIKRDQDLTYQNGNIFEILEDDNLIKQLLEGLKLTPLVWEANKNNGVKLFIREGVWHGYSHKDGRIEIGKNQVPKEIKNERGLPDSYSEEEVKRYIFSHENNHHVLFYLYKNQNEIPEFGEMYHFLKNRREKTNKGLSQLGNMKIYNQDNKNTAHEEDFVELLNRFCINPLALKNYLYYLATTNEELLNKNGLQKISEKEAIWIFKQISLCIGKFLEGNNIAKVLKK